MLGRVVAIDYGLALAFEALSATLAGILQDNVGLNAREVSTILGIAALALFVLWLCYSIFGAHKGRRAISLCFGWRFFSRYYG